MQTASTHARIAHAIDAAAAQTAAPSRLPGAQSSGALSGAQRTQSLASATSHDGIPQSGVDLVTATNSRGARLESSKPPVVSGTGMGKVLDAAHSFAALTDFEGTGSKVGTAGVHDNSAIGQAVYQRLQQFDKDYLQPMFGRGEGETLGHENSDKAEGSNAKGDGSPVTHL
jgi:hypothetical protein